MLRKILPIAAFALLTAVSFDAQAACTKRHEQKCMCQECKCEGCECAKCKEKEAKEEKCPKCAEALRYLEQKKHGNHNNPARYND